MDKMMATLVHISTNMWLEEDNKTMNKEDTWEMPGSHKLRLDKELWDKYMIQLKEAGNNTLIMDLGDGVVFDSHPEIAVEGAWTRAELEAEVAKLKAMGFKLIPKMNFSATHDYWMKDYARMLSTPAYYKFCADIIAEACEIFKPEYFHIGMDEEGYPLQEHFDYVVIRQHDAWWKDVYFYINEVEKHGVRPIMWADYAREKLDEFIEKCPKSVVPMVWYYNEKYYGELPEWNMIRVRPFKALIEAGFDIMAAGSIVFYEGNFPLLAEYCKNNLDQSKFFGYCETTWQAVLPKYEEKLELGMEMVRQAVAVLEE